MTAPNWRLAKFSDKANFKFTVLQVPGIHVPPPLPHSEPEPIIELLKNFNAEFREDSYSALMQHEGELTMACKKRLLWLCGGGSRLAIHFLTDQRANMASYYCFIEYVESSKKRYPTRRELQNQSKYALYQKEMQIESYPSYSDLKYVKTKEVLPLLSPQQDLGECPVCLDTLYAADNASLPCNHLVCYSCVFDYVQVLINDGKTGSQSLVCPERGCSQNYNPYHILELCDGDEQHPMFVKYLTFQVMNSFEYSPFLRYCSNSTCGRLIITDLGRRRVVCRHCNTVTCLRCRKKYHKLPICRRRDISYSPTGFRTMLYYLRNGTRPCPQCRFLIEKTRGCDHMTCAKCNFEFCWRCGQKYTPDHFNSPLNCAGGRGAYLEIWGPFAPLKMLYEVCKDIAYVLLVIMFLVFGFPFSWIKYREDVYEFIGERAEGAGEVIERWIERIGDCCTFRRRPTRGVDCLQPDTGDSERDVEYERQISADFQSFFERQTAPSANSNFLGILANGQETPVNDFVADDIPIPKKPIF